MQKHIRNVPHGFRGGRECIRGRVGTTGSREAVTITSENAEGNTVVF